MASQKPAEQIATNQPILMTFRFFSGNVPPLSG
jgi:hypothetical protein